MTAHSLLAITLFVTDVDRSAAFYGAIGFDTFAYGEPGRDRYFDAASSNIIIQLVASSERNRLSHNQLGGVRVPDLQTVAAALDCIDVAYERTAHRGLTTTDPDGNRVYVIERG